MQVFRSSNRGAVGVRRVRFAARKSNDAYARGRGRETAGTGVDRVCPIDELTGAILPGGIISRPALTVEPETTDSDAADRRL